MRVIRLILTTSLAVVVLRERERERDYVRVCAFSLGSVDKGQSCQALRRKGREEGGWEVRIEGRGEGRMRGRGVEEWEEGGKEEGAIAGQVNILKLRRSVEALGGADNNSGSSSKNDKHSGHKQEQHQQQDQNSISNSSSSRKRPYGISHIRRNKEKQG